MLISDLEHLESIDVQITALRGRSGILFLDLTSKTLSLKLADKELFKTELSSLISGVVLALPANQTASVSYTTGSGLQPLLSIGLS